MARFETWLQTDLKQLPSVIHLPGDAFSQDAGANRIGVELYNGGQSVTVVGDVSGSIITPDGQTVTVSGSKSTNKAWIFLPASALATPGFISVFIKLTDNGVVTTIGACDGKIVQTRTS